MSDKQILFNEQAVNDRIAAMAADIVRHYADKDVLFIALLNGGLPFAAKLMTAIQRRDPLFKPNLQTMMVSSYGSSRQVLAPRLVTDLPTEYRNLKGRHIILLDDLIDGGTTLAFARQHLLDYGAAAVDLVVLVKKRKRSSKVHAVTMYGFEAPDEWLVGMGMDDASSGPETDRWAESISIALNDN